MTYKRTTGASRRKNRKPPTVLYASRVVEDGKVYKTRPLQVGVNKLKRADRERTIAIRVESRKKRENVP